jgi:hypothetical protein
MIASHPPNLDLDPDDDREKFPRNGADGPLAAVELPG